MASLTKHKDSLATRFARRRARGAWPTCARTWPTRLAAPLPSTGFGLRCSARWVRWARGLQRARRADVTRMAWRGRPCLAQPVPGVRLAATVAHEQPPLRPPDRALNLTRAVACPWPTMALTSRLLSMRIWSSGPRRMPDTARAAGARQGPREHGGMAAAGKGHAQRSPPNLTLPCHAHRRAPRARRPGVRGCRGRFAAGDGRTARRAGHRVRAGRRRLHCGRCPAPLAAGGQRGALAGAEGAPPPPDPMLHPKPILAAGGHCGALSSARGARHLAGAGRSRGGERCCSHACPLARPSCQPVQAAPPARRCIIGHAHVSWPPASRLTAPPTMLCARARAALRRASVLSSAKLSAQGQTDPTAYLRPARRCWTTTPRAAAARARVAAATPSTSRKRRWSGACSGCCWRRRAPATCPMSRARWRPWRQTRVGRPAPNPSHRLLHAPQRSPSAAALRAATAFGAIADPCTLVARPDASRTCHSAVVHAGGPMLCQARR